MFTYSVARFQYSKYLNCFFGCYRFLLRYEPNTSVLLADKGLMRQKFKMVNGDNWRIFKYRTEYTSNNRITVVFYSEDNIRCEILI